MANGVLHKIDRYSHRSLFIAVVMIVLNMPAHSGQPTLDVAATDNAFGFRLLAAVQATNPRGNVVLSPVSAALNLSMMLNGTTDQTRKEILAMLALRGRDLRTINTANAGLIQTLRKPIMGVTVSIADALWVNSERAQLRPYYVEQMQTAYEAELGTLSFLTPDAVTRINGWASQATNGRISDIIDRVDPADLVILLDAVYFKGRWTHKFDQTRTLRRGFTLAEGTVKQIPRMAQIGRFDYVETPEMQAIRLPFGDASLVMDVLLPSSSSSLNALEAKLAADNGGAWRTQFTPRSGTIELPRFELKSTYRLNEELHDLGMVRAFNPRGAQLAGMFSAPAGHARTEKFFISVVQQSTYWKVDEDGAEAAAVTTTGVRTAALARPLPAFQMLVDRPFFCAIEDRRSGALLFVAAINDPAT